MRNSEFTLHVTARENRAFSNIRERFSERVIRLLHASTGLNTEAGEFADAMKKHIFYGTPLDDINLIEELGDILWYIHLAADELNVSIEEIMDVNNKKLTARYGTVFSKEKATERDLDTEREILENVHHPE